MNQTRQPSGDCYQAAFDCLDRLSQAMEFGEIKRLSLFLIHGDVIPGSGADKGRRINHAWVEVADNVLDESNHKTLEKPINIYRETLQARERIRYSMEDAREKMLISNNYGPWDTDSAEPTP